MVYNITALVVDSVGADLVIPTYLNIARRKSLRIYFIINQYPLGGTGDWTGEGTGNEDDFSANI
ncbi:MAG: hypothetical protein R2727_06720 [Bacteroidales bacterium]